MKLEILLARLARGHYSNISFHDARRLIEAFGFRLIRVTGSHHVFNHPGIPGLLNLQEAGGDAKAYQLRQFLRLVERYNLRLETEP